MEITIKLDGRMVSVEVSTEIGEFWEQGKRINRKLYREQQRYWDSRECDEYIIAAEGRLPYRSGKPLIVTTNLKLDELKHPPDLAHARIYDRILERCAPVLFTGKNFRENNAARTKAAARQIIVNSKTL